MALRKYGPLKKSMILSNKYTKHPKHIFFKLDTRSKNMPSYVLMKKQKKIKWLSTI